MLSARRAADIQPATMDQAVLADFMIGGHFGRHLRRMRTEDAGCGGTRSLTPRLGTAAAHCASVQS
jgi:hypothetical protein